MTDLQNAKVKGEEEVEWCQARREEHAAMDVTG